MPTKPEGVYQDGHGKWYVKVTIGRDPLTGRRAQVTKRGFRTAAEAGRARREMLDQVARRQLRPAPRATTVNDLLTCTWTASMLTAAWPQRRVSTTGSPPTSTCGPTWALDASVT